MSIVHVAAMDVQVNSVLRQRCAWCGALLLDYDLTRIAVRDGEDPRPSTWPAGTLVEVDGNAKWVLPATDELPPSACAVIDLEVTR